MPQDNRLIGMGETHMSMERRPPVSEYYLQSDVYLSMPGNSGILLDLRSGDYIGLESGQVRALSRIVRGWPTPRTSASQTVPTANEVAELVRTLTTRRLLTQQKSLGKEARPISVDAVTRVLVDRDFIQAPRVRLFHRLTLLLACVRAYLLLRLWPLGRVLRVARDRKVRETGVVDEGHLEDLSHLLSIFIHLRPFYYSWNDKCLFDSLVLIEFLARYRHFPLWVIGVKTDPFLAHSWVQHGDCVLNGGLEFTQQFTPIVAI